MTLTTYDGMVAELPGEFFNNTQLTTARCQRYISQAEARMIRRLRTTGMLIRFDLVVGTATEVDDDDALFEIPDDILGIASFQIAVPDEDEPAVLRFADVLDLAGKAAKDDTRAQPEFFAWKAGEGRLWPIPDQEYTATIHAYRSPTALSDATQTNLWIDRYYDVLYDLACARAAAFLKEWDDATRFDAIAERGLQEIEAEAKRELAINNRSNRRARLTTEAARLQRRQWGYNIETDV
jgi:hypothetical protein